MKKRRTFTREFKLSILREMNVKSYAEICRERNLHPVMLSKWKREFREDPKKAFSGHGNL